MRGSNQKALAGNFGVLGKWVLMGGGCTCRGGSRGRVQGVRTPPEMTRGFLMQLVFCKNYVVYWC